MFGWFRNIPLDSGDLRANTDGIESLPTKNSWKLKRMLAMKRLTKNTCPSLYKKAPIKCFYTKNC